MTEGLDEPDPLPAVPEAGDDEELEEDGSLMQVLGRRTSVHFITPVSLTMKQT